jgi:DNA-binding GntR family transcriptional regulator
VSSDSVLPPIRQVHLKDAAYGAIKKAIATLALAPGALISEADLAAQLGISKTPIRHALTRLEQEGLVYTMPFRGTFVAEVDSAEAGDLTELRIALEEGALWLAIQRSSDDELEDLRALAEATAADERAGEHEHAIQEIADFHSRLVELSRNRRIVEAYAGLATPLARIRAISGAVPGSVTRSSSEHAEVIGAMIRRDEQGARELLREHLLGVLALYLSKKPHSDGDQPR